MKKISGKNILLRGLLIVCAMAAALIFGCLYLTGAFKGTPKLEVQPLGGFAETMHVVTDADYEPFSYLDENGAYTGLDVELITQIANRLEMNLDLTLTDWASVNAAVSSGEADIIMNMETDLVTADSGLIATIPTTEKQYVAYGRDDADSVIDLYGKRVASLHRLPQLELDITYIPSYAAMFEEMKEGKYDYVICPIQVGNSFLEKLDIKNVRPSYAVGHVYGALALPADKVELRDRLNDVLKSLSDEGYLDRLDRKWVNHRYEYSSVSSIIKGHPVFAAMLMAGLLLLVVLGLLYIMVQRRSAAVRENYTKQLQDNLEVIRAARVKAYMDELTGVRNKNAYKEMADELQLSVNNGTAGPFAIGMFDLNGLKEMNDRFGHQAGDQLIRDACHLICHIYDHSPVFRVGGDEFVAVLRGQDYENREALMAQMKAIVLKNQEEGKVIVAAGMAEHDGQEPVADVFARADKAMYANKSTLKGARR